MIKVTEVRIIILWLMMRMTMTRMTMGIKDDGADNDNDHECDGDDDDSGRTFDIACSSCSKPFPTGHFWLLLEPVMIDD